MGIPIIKIRQSHNCSYLYDGESLSLERLSFLFKQGLVQSIPAEALAVWLFVSRHQQTGYWLSVLYNMSQFAQIVDGDDGDGDSDGDGDDDGDGDGDVSDGDDGWWRWQWQWWWQLRQDLMIYLSISVLICNGCNLVFDCLCSPSHRHRHGAGWPALWGATGRGCGPGHHAGGRTDRHAGGTIHPAEHRRWTDSVHTGTSYIQDSTKWYSSIIKCISFNSMMYLYFE